MMDYLEFCPSCGSSDVTCGGSQEYSTIVTNKMYCEDCDAHWETDFQLVFKCQKNLVEVEK